jgi:peroxiredoxin
MRTILLTLLCAITLIAADPPKRAPGFSLPDVKMEWHDLADFHGKPLILEFMQTTCPHCATFAAALEKVQQKFGNKVAILSVCNPPDNPRSMATYITGHNISYPVVYDTGQVAFSYLRVTQFDLPQVFVIDANGMIQRHFEYGAMTRDVFEGDGLLSEIGRVLGGSTPSKK